jgi:hypothetical protein
MSTTPNLNLPYIDAGQAQKHVTHNEALRALDTLVQLAVLDRDLTAPPSSPAEGQRWIVKAGATDAWAGHDNEIAAWQDGAWQFSVPAIGWIAYIADEEILVAWDGAAWSAVSGGGGSDPTELQNMTLLGVGTTADATNPLNAKLNNVLWTAKTVAEGGDGDLRYKLSKESTTNTLSLLLQDNFTGCAEIGLTGDDDFHFKVSPDGTSWLEALKIERATGKVSFPVMGGPREILTASRTYYVRTDGSDSNSGLSNSSGGAFLTVQKAIDVVLAAIDLNGFDVTIQIGNGTFTDPVLMGGPQVGQGKIVILGDAATPSNVVVSTTSASAITVQNGGVLYVSGLKVQTTTAGYGLRAIGGKIVLCGKMDFGAVANYHMYAQYGGQIEGSIAYNITGAAQAHFASSNGRIISQGVSVTLSGSLNFSSAFARADTAGVVLSNGNTFSGGTITGARYLSTTSSIIQTFGGGANYFPGDTTGTAATGQYA